MFKIKSTSELMAMTKVQLVDQHKDIFKRLEDEVSHLKQTLSNVRKLNDVLEDEATEFDKTITNYKKDFTQVKTDLAVVKCLLSLDSRDFKTHNKQVANDLARIIASNIRCQIDTCIDYVDEVLGENK